MLLEVGTSGLSPGVYSVTIAAELGAEVGNGTGVGTLNSTHTFQLQGSLAGPLAYIPGGARQGFNTEEVRPGAPCPKLTIYRSSARTTMTDERQSLNAAAAAVLEWLVTFTFIYAQLRFSLLCALSTILSSES